MSFGKKEIILDESVKSSKLKLERSIAANRIIKKGEKIKDSDIHLLSPGDGFKWFEKNKIIGKITSKEIGKNEIIYSNKII